MIWRKMGRFYLDIPSHERDITVDFSGDCVGASDSDVGVRYISIPANKLAQGYIKITASGTLPSSPIKLESLSPLQKAGRLDVQYTVREMPPAPEQKPRANIDAEILEAMKKKSYDS